MLLTYSRMYKGFRLTGLLRLLGAIWIVLPVLWLFSIWHMDQVDLVHWSGINVNFSSCHGFVTFLFVFVRDFSSSPYPSKFSVYHYYDNDWVDAPRSSGVSVQNFSSNRYKHYEVQVIVSYRLVYGVISVWVASVGYLDRRSRRRAVEGCGKRERESRTGPILSPRKDLDAE
jgi:hypothetical protein